MPALLEVPLSITEYFDCSPIKSDPHPPVFFASISKQESCSRRVRKDIKMWGLKLPVLICLRILALIGVVRCLFAAGIGGKLKDIVDAPTRAGQSSRVLRLDSVIFASHSILTGGSKNLRAVHRGGDVKLLV